MLGLLAAGAAAFGPQLAGKAVAYGATRGAAKVAQGRVSAFLASAAGRQALGGGKIASAAASGSNSRLGGYIMRREMGQTLRGTQNKTPPSPQPTTMATSPKTADPNLVSPQYEQAERHHAERMAVMGQQLRNQQRGPGGGGTGFGGTGKGWWELNEQLTGKQAWSKPEELGDYSVARGPTTWALPGQATVQKVRAGVAQGLAQGANRAAELSAIPAADTSAPDVSFSRKSSTGRPASHASTGTNPTAGNFQAPTAASNPYQAPSAAPRSARFSQGAGETQEADVVGEHNLTNVRSGRGSGVATASTSGTYQGMGTSINGASQGRLSSFSSGTGELGTGPSAIGPGPQPKKERLKPGLGDYGRNRFASMMAGHV